MSKNSTIARLDWVTIGLYMLLVILGWFNIYSAVFTEDQTATFSFSSRYGRQLLWIGASMVIIAIALIIDSKFYSSFAFVIYGVVIVLLIAVLIFGTRINGAKSWFVMGPIRLQPAEFAKFATSLALAKFLSIYNLKPEKFKTFLKFTAIAFFPSVLILAQNDTGSALVFAVFFLVFFREGMPVGYLLAGFLAMAIFVLSLLYDNYVVVIILEVLALFSWYVIRRDFKQSMIGALVVGLLTFLAYYVLAFIKPDLPLTYPVLIGLVLSTIWFLVKIYKQKLRNAFYILMLLYGAITFTYSVDYGFNKILDGYQQRRIKVLLGIENDPYGAGYNVNQSMIAIGSGGPFGKGYLQGTQTKFKFVPEQSTDFIFCTVGEEWGFVGTSFVLVLFLLLMLRIIMLAEKQKSKFSRIYGYCVASLLFFHVAINVGMTIGLAPVIGIPLPFFSYGGSSLWGFTFLLFIFLKLDTNRNELIN